MSYVIRCECIVVKVTVEIFVAYSQVKEYDIVNGLKQRRTMKSGHLSTIVYGKSEKGLKTMKSDLRFL